MTGSDWYRTAVTMLSSSCRITFFLALFLAIPIALDDTHSNVLEVAEADDTLTAAQCDAWLYGRAGDDVFDGNAIKAGNIRRNWTGLKDEAPYGFRILPVETYLRCGLAEVLRHDLQPFRMIIGPEPVQAPQASRVPRPKPLAELVRVGRLRGLMIFVR